MENQNFNKSDYNLLVGIAGLKPEVLHKAMEKYLKTKYEKVYSTNTFIYAVGDSPVALVAHLDTVFSTPPTEEDIFYDTNKNVMWSVEGGLGDDRAGVFAIIKLIENKTHNLPSVIFTMGEEEGGIGASDLVVNIDKPQLPLKYVIELDRRGEDDCVFYDCYNRDFVKYVESFGFHEAFGSFTDISYIGPFWEVACVNLSIGYEDEHSYSERLYVSYLKNTIDKVKKMLEIIEDAPFFEYIENPFKFHRKGAQYEYPLEDDSFFEFDEGTEEACCMCGDTHPYYNMVHVIEDDGTVDAYCEKCDKKYLDYCEMCGLPLRKDEVRGKDMGVKWCQDCYEGVLSDGRNSDSI